MQKQKVLELPFPSTALICDPLLYIDMADLLLSMSFDDNKNEVSFRLKFLKQRAFRKRSEIYCTEWHIADPYDTVCEIKESDWVAELRNDAVPEWRDYWVMRHFIIYIDSFGCLEVIANSVQLLDGK